MGNIGNHIHLGNFPILHRHQGVKVTMSDTSKNMNSKEKISSWQATLDNVF